MSGKGTRAAEQAEEARALLELAEQSARHAAVAAEDRAARDRMLRDFRNEMERDRREFMASMAQQAEAATAAVTPPVTAPQPRDTATGRWLPAAPEPEPEPEPVDLSALSMAEYRALRSQLGMDARGIEHVGRAPGYERQEYLGHRIEDGSGFSDWRDFASGNRVFESQLNRTRGKEVPVGFQRPDTGDWS